MKQPVSELAAGRVVAAAFGERLADALRQAAVHLAFDDHRVDHLAEVVHRGKAIDAHRAGVAVDLDLADVGAGGEGEVGRVVERVLVQAGLELVVRVVVRHIGGKRHLAEHLLAVGARHLEFAAVVLDVGLRRLEQVRGDLLALGDDLVERLHDRRAAHRDASASRRCPCRTGPSRCRRARWRRCRSACPGGRPPPARRWSRGPGRANASR